jgi:hypothetical protein
MKVLSLVSTLFAVAYAVPTELVAENVENVEDVSAAPNAGENGVKILPRFSQGP